MAGKEYTTAPILVNSDGHPIPQYLDITDTTDSPQGTFKPLTQLQAERPDVQNVQLTGRNVEKESFYDALALADTERHMRTVDLSKYKQFQVMARSSLDVDLEIIIVYNNRVPRIWDEAGWTPNFRRLTIPADNIDINLLNTYLDWLDRPLDFLRIDIQAANTPSSGIVDIYALGVVN